MLRKRSEEIRSLTCGTNKLHPASFHYAVARKKRLCLLSEERLPLRSTFSQGCGEKEREALPVTAQPIRAKMDDGLCHLKWRMEFISALAIGTNEGYIKIVQFTPVFLEKFSSQRG